ncbi:putative NRPS-like protein biosynthetic cluster, partial [Ascosphaera atra]
MVQCITSPGLEVDSVSSFPKDLLSVTPAKERHITSETYLLHGLFENTARRIPESIALEFVSREGAGLGKKTWSYGEVDRMANRYAHLLQHHKASSGDLVATCFDKCPEAYFSILGVLKAGCAYVAIDPTAPVARKKFIMEDSGAKLLMTTSDMRKDLDDLSGVEVIVIDDDSTLRKFPEYPPKLERPVDPQDTCYCLYTSGTTGTPKGCEITHDNAVQAMLAFQRLFAGHWDSSSRWLQFASFHFDVSVLEQYWSWSVGICLVACPRDILFEDLPGTLSSLEITHIDLTPSLARLVHPEEVPSLKRGVFITGGEQLRQDILDAWGQHEVIYNGYGPTEVTIGCTMYPRVPRNGKPSNIGPQFDNVSSFVFKPKTNIPVLRGGVGELCVGGPLVGKGYLNRNELTRERFVELEEYHDRVYRTGDLVRMHHNGTFCFMGRQDDQVKLRGQRLEIGEINETIMRSSKKIKGAATMVLKHAKQTKEQLVSFIAPTEPVHSNQTIEVDFGAALQDVATARDACKAALPGYMVPTHIIPLKKMPLSANNKLDFNRLKAIYNDLSLEQLQQLTKSSSAGSVPLTEELKRFTSLIAEIMGLEPSTVTPESNLLELGLDSISVISFTKALREHGFEHASAAQVMKSKFQRPPRNILLLTCLLDSTVSQLWKILGSKEEAGTKLTDVYQEAKQRLAAYTQANVRAVANELHVPMEAVERVAPCTPLQEGMIYHYLESQGKAYMASFNYELSADISIPRLRQAWKKAQENIPILRTSFVLARGGYAQAVVRDRELPLSEQESSSDDD